ncbi:MICOS complex subunit mic60 [Vanrija albida]|uniref:MICOS complex subunit MIC60 n=1 Tax=Vanrija albida TaxID=181172 RepID=A0ABR3Q9L5_9TREE
MNAQLRTAPSRASRALVQRRLLSNSAPLRNQVPLSPEVAGTPKKSGGFFRKLVNYTIFGAIIFYPVSGYLSTQSETYRDLFTKVPGGEQVADYADEHDWDQFGPGSITKSLLKLTGKSNQEADATVADAKKAVGDATASAQAAAAEAARKASEAKDAAAARALEAQKAAKAKAAELANKASAKATEVANKTSDATAKLADKVEHAIHDAKKTVVDPVVDKAAETAAAGAKAIAEASEPVYPLPDTARPRQLRPETVTPQKPSYEGKEEYSGPKLPLGFEPPPGYYVKGPAPKPKTPGDEPLPQLVTKVKELAANEPIISQLASTIDSLTTSLSSNKGGPSAQAADILDKAQGDLNALNQRLSDIKKAEQERLQKAVDSKQAEFEVALKQKQDEWQKGEEGLKESWDAERQKMIDGWRSVLDGELDAQRQNIEARLHDEVVSQGIELQRRWLRSIKSQVETERGGRLAKLDHLNTSLKQLERITLDNSAVLDDNIRLHKVWSALRAVQSKAERGDQSFDDELRVLQGLTKSDDKSIVDATLSSLESSGIAQTGVKSLSALSSWFTNAVAPRIQSASLVPAPEEAGVGSHLASATLSKILFRPKAGLVDGDDVAAVLARAEWALQAKDLDAAAREVNSLRGWPKQLAADWLREARRRLEVQQALDIVSTDATLASLLLV